MEKILEFLKNCGTFYIATIDKDQPRVRPFGVIEIFENHLYIQTGKKKEVFKQIEINPNVEICGMKDGKWIRVTGKLVLDDRIEAKKYILDQNPMLRNMYSELDDNTAVLYFETGKAIISSFTEDAITIEF